LHCSTLSPGVNPFVVNNNNNNNKTDIIILDNERGTCMLIDVAISGDRNVIKKRSREDFKIQRL
jgi:hypothetical protein